MAMEKEALTNTIESDLAKRNRNWDKVDGHLADMATDVDGAHGLKYERGTFTPVLKFTSGAGVLTVNSANYIKVNSLVYFTLYIIVNVTTASGGLSIGGIPYPNRGGFTAISVVHQTLFEADGGAVDISSNIVFFKGTSSPVLASTGIRYAMVSGTYITD